MGRFLSQLKALIWKNILLKKRNKKQLFPELLMPIYFVALLSLIKALISPETQPAILGFPEHRILDQSVFPRPSSEVYVSPDSPSIRSVMNMVASDLNITYTVFPSQQAAEKAYLNKTSTEVYGVVFNYKNGAANYAIRIPYKTAPTSSSIFNYLTGGCVKSDGLGSCMANRYLSTGFVALQIAINTAMIRNNSIHTSLPLPDISAKLFPKPAYTPNTAYIQILSAIYFVIAYSPFINFLVINLVVEKEKKIKEGMRMMGMKDSAFWLSWWIVYTVIILAVTLIVVGIAAVSKFFTNSNMLIFFLMLFLYGLSIISFSFAITPFFNKALSAGALASFASMAISMLYLVVSLTRTTTTRGDVDYTIPPEWRWVLCLLSPVALALAIDQAIFLDIGRGGMDFQTISYGNFPLYCPIIMLFVDTVLYAALAIYFDNVVPSEYGQRRPLLYIFMPSYWCGGGNSSGEMTHLISSDHCSINTNTQTDRDVEPVSTDLHGKEGIRLVGLRKVYKGSEGEVVAVDDLTLDMYEGQITGLLGHNGAGKTTLINMLTGLTPATGGKATVLKMDISDPNAMDQIRAQCGVCPQHNILFDRLTPREHLRLFAAIKNMSANKIETAVEESLINVDLTDRGDTRADELSGGQKRKLSVAIALIGDPKVIFLDEPTAGMDPYSRRHLWSYLQNTKKGKIILLTTHFMDEADILADRKAIISKGNLRCCGSSLFLKTRFGIGYHLNMVVNQDCSVQKITKFVSKHLDGIKLSRSHGNELSFTLPLAQVHKFPELFNGLEDTGNSDSLGIRTFGVSMTTLEEVFLKLEEDSDLQSDKNKVEEKAVTNGANHTLDSSGEQNSSIELSPIQEMGTSKNQNLTKQRFLALMKIRYLTMIRNKMAVIFQLLLPVIFVIVGCLVNKYAVPPNSSAAPLSLKMERALGSYVKIKDVNVKTAAPAIIIDSSGSGSVSLFNAALEAFAYMEEADDTWDFLNVTPHHIGVNFTTFDAADDGYDLKFTALYNDTSVHSLPAIIDLVLNIVYGLLLGGAPDTRISTYNLPWNSTEAVLTFQNSVFSATILISIAFVIIPSGFATHVVREREWKARSQLRVSGVSWFMYWGTMFLFNILQYLVPAILCVLIVLAASVESLMNGGAILSLIILLILYMPMNTLLAYNFSFAFKKHETSMSVLPNFFLFSSLLPYIAVSLCDLMGSYETALIVHYIACVFVPTYLVYGGIYFIDRMHRVKLLTNVELSVGDYFQFENGIVIVYIMAVVHIVWLYFLLLLLEVRSTGGDPRDVFKYLRGEDSKKLPVPEKNSDVIENEDSDVAAERQHVDNLQKQDPKEVPVIVVKNLRKEFKNREKKKGNQGCCKKGRKEDRVKVAVRNSTFAVNPGEVFGLLGPNGAGKTTTMNMVIAEEGMTKGKIEVAGSNIRSSMGEAFQALGFCPQHDALWEPITLKEHLQCYASIRGVPASEIPATVKYYIDSLELGDYADRRAKKLSGGTKRKLSYAMSMLGNPRVVLMDEPSTGMDPQSKRFLWDTISNSFQFKDRGAILTTHYMEEADILCTRVAIMVNGQIQCLGPTQHLKDKFGSGYVLEVKVKTGSRSNVTEARSEVTEGKQRSDETVDDKMAEFENYIKTIFSKAVCVEVFGERAQFKIPKENIQSLGKTFTALEEAKTRYDLAEYSFSQSTLEQVFLTFAKQQIDEGEEKGEITNGSVRITDTAINSNDIAEVAV